MALPGDCPAQSSASAPPPIAGGFRGKPLRILLVEDDGNVSALMVELLTEMGHDVCNVATTEPEAVAAAERLSPDLMIVDIRLRVGGGVPAMATILRRTAMPHIFMTGGSRQGIPDNAAILHKPFGALGLTAALDSIASQITPATSARDSV